jgi:hypothetical protein
MAHALCMLDKKGYTCARTSGHPPPSTHTRTEMRNTVHCNSGFSNAPQRYVIRTLPVLLPNDVCFDILLMATGELARVNETLHISQRLVVCFKISFESFIASSEDSAV